MDARQYAPYKAGAANQSMGARRPSPIRTRCAAAPGTIRRMPSAAPRASLPIASWKQQDPQLPKSIWYLTDAQWLGFRLVRPAKIPTAEEMYQYWNNGVEHDEQ